MSAKHCYIDRVLNRLAGEITDRVFLMIENDKEPMQEYRKLVASGTNQHGLNSSIGKQIRVKFNLENDGICTKPKSTLIKSYTRHKIK